MKPTRPAKNAAAASPGRTWLKIGFVVLLAILAVKMFSWLTRPDIPPPAQHSGQSAITDDASAVAPGGPSKSDSSAPAPADASRSVTGAPEDPETMHADACTSFGAQLHLPGDTRVIAVAASAGRKTGFRIDAGAEATQIEVAVNSPDHPVVLMVSGKGPTIWNFGTTAGTRVLAVLASGKDRQAIAGLDRDTPTLASKDSSQCGYFSIERADIQTVNPISLHVFQRPADRVLLGSGDSVVAGDPIPPGTGLARSPDTAPETFRDDSAAPATEAPAADGSTH